MRKLLFIFIFSTVSGFSQSQIDVSFGGGITVGKATPMSKIAFSLGAKYLLDTDHSIQFGPFVGVNYFKSQGIYKDMLFLPLGVALKFHSSEDRFFVGTNLGYGMAVLSGGSFSENSGLYFSPSIGYMMNNYFSISVVYSVVNRNMEPAFIGFKLSFDKGRNGSSRYVSF